MKSLTNVTTAEFIADMTTIMSGITTWVITMMDIFMQPPLNMFVGLAIFGSVAYLVKGMLHR